MGDPVNWFIDPRTDPTLRPGSRTPRMTDDPGALDELIALCRRGRLYDVERWIAAGRPLQLEVGTRQPRHHPSSALAVALESGNQALVLVLLANDFDPNSEQYSPLDLALRARRRDLLDLLLDWSTDPKEVDVEELLGTYDTKLFERFLALGVDFTAGHALAETLAHHTSNKPAFGFARRHRLEVPGIQAELNSALAYHVGEGNEKGLQLCLWAGADPHAPARSLRWGSADEDDDFLGFSAVREACSRGNAQTLVRLKPDPDVDEFEDLYLAASSRSVIQYLAGIQPPQDVGALIGHYIARSSWGISRWLSDDTLRALFDLGATWQRATNEEVAAVRHRLLRTTDDRFVELIKLLALGGHCSPGILAELARTPAFRRRLKQVRFIPGATPPRNRWEDTRPTRFREVLRALGITLPKPERVIPSVVEIGWHRPDTHRVVMSRAELFDLVWSTPVSRLAERWGMSGPGLRKACQRIEVPVPPRGHWARTAAGAKERRPSLPKLGIGQAEEIGVWVEAAGGK